VCGCCLDGGAEEDDEGEVKLKGVSSSKSVSILSSADTEPICNSNLE
jgi:hypothetical protein